MLVAETGVWHVFILSGKIYLSSSLLLLSPPDS